MLNLLLTFSSLALTEAGHHTTGKSESPMTQLLKGAIQRGVPMFNKGWHESCAMVYETALHAVVLGGERWGLAQNDLKALEEGFEEAMAMDSMTSKAWAYRKLMDGVMHGQHHHHHHQGSSKKDSKSEKVTLFDFESPQDARSWEVVLDGVMGGKSTGEISSRAGKMVFQGATSLANNGGFSMIRTNLAPGSLDGFNTLRMRVRGDGRTYILGAKGPQNFSYWSRFPTKKGEWTVVDVDIKEMEKHWYGMRRPGTIDPSEVRGLEFYVNDKQAGPFKLKVDWIRAMA